jgi:alcohol dehydrogenase (cytochrome c)
MPFPVDVPDFNIADIDVKTGRTSINWDKVLKEDGDTTLVCFHNTKSYWPVAYHPGTKSVYIPYHDYCLEMNADMSNPNGYSQRSGRVRPGVPIEKAHALVKLNLETGETTKFLESAVPGNGAVLATAGNLIFWGDMNRRFRAFDAENGRILWETMLGGIVQMSTITYAVDGKQYIAVMTGDGNSATRNPVDLADLTTPRGHNAIYVFALP